MKKVLGLLLLTAIAGGQSLFAQDEEGGGLKITGQIESGIRLRAGNEYSKPVRDGDLDEKDKFFIDAFNDDAGKAFRSDVQVDYTTPNAGVSIRLRADDDNFKVGGIPQSYGYSLLGHAYGWFSFINNIVEVSGGMLDNAKWGTFTGDIFDTNLDNANGVKLEIRPIEGLSLGVNTFSINPDYLKCEFVDAFAGTVVGAKFTNEAFGIAASFIFNAKEAKAQDNGNNVVAKARAKDVLKVDGDFGTLFSLYYYGISNLKLDLDGRFARDSDSELNSFGIGLQGNYSISEPLFAGIRAKFETAPAKEDNPAILEIRPQAGYTVNEWLALRLEVPVTLAGAKGLEDADLGIGVKPKATFTISPNASVAFWYVLNTMTPKDGDTGVDHTIQLDLIWKF
ncbi:MAG: hypothetical protein LBG74_00430 [Spirochaetaceae bacterium]|jgi:hypothetical protein|nr:hypothetical protein [Spirochaetaceae bacterium]